MLIIDFCLFYKIFHSYIIDSKTITKVVGIKQSSKFGYIFEIVFAKLSGD